MSSPNPTSVLKEEEIRPQALMAEQQRRFANDIARLLKSKAAFVQVPCPACGGARHAPAWVKYELSYVTCLDCQTVYITPRAPPAAHRRILYPRSALIFFRDQLFPTICRNADFSAVFVGDRL